VEAFTTPTPQRERTCLRTYLNTGNVPLGQNGDPFFLWQRQETLMHIMYSMMSVHQMRQAAVSPPEPLTEVLAALFPLDSLFIHSLTKALPSCRTSSSTSSRPCPCWLFMSPEEVSLMGGILVTVGPVSIHAIILSYLQTEHHWAASTCSSVNLQEVASDVRVSLLRALLCFPISVFSVTLPFLSFVVHCS